MDAVIQQFTQHLNHAGANPRVAWKARQVQDRCVDWPVLGTAVGEASRSLASVGVAPVPMTPLGLALWCASTLVP